MVERRQSEAMVGWHPHPGLLSLVIAPVVLLALVLASPRWAMASSCLPPVAELVPIESVLDKPKAVLPGMEFGLGATEQDLERLWGQPGSVRQTTPQFRRYDQGVVWLEDGRVVALARTELPGIGLDQSATPAHVTFVFGPPAWSVSIKEGASQLLSGPIVGYEGSAASLYVDLSQSADSIQYYYLVEKGSSLSFQPPSEVARVVSKTPVLDRAELAAELQQYIALSYACDAARQELTEHENTAPQSPREEDEQLDHVTRFQQVCGQEGKTSRLRSLELSLESCLERSFFEVIEVLYRGASEEASARSGYFASTNAAAFRELRRRTRERGGASSDFLQAYAPFLWLQLTMPRPGGACSVAESQGRARGFRNAIFEEDFRTANELMTEEITRCQYAVHEVAGPRVEREFGEANTHDSLFPQSGYSGWLEKRYPLIVDFSSGVIPPMSDVLVVANSAQDNWDGMPIVHVLEKLPLLERASDARKVCDASAIDLTLDPEKLTTEALVATEHRLREYIGCQKKATRTVAGEVERHASYEAGVESRADRFHSTMGMLYRRWTSEPEALLSAVIAAVTSRNTVADDEAHRCRRSEQELEWSLEWLAELRRQFDQEQASTARSGVINFAAQYSLARDMKYVAEGIAEAGALFVEECQ